MSSDVLKLVSGDQKPFIVLTFKDELTGDPYPLNRPDVQVFVKFREAGSDEKARVIPCSIIGDGSDGRVEFNFTGGVLDVPAGMYEGEVLIVEGGLQQRIYQTIRFRVRDKFDA